MQWKTGDFAKVVFYGPDGRSHGRFAKALKLEKQLADIQGENARLAKERINALRRATVLTEASKQGFADPSDAWRFVDLETLVVDDNDSVAGVDDALRALAESKPYLLGQKANQPKLAPTSLPTGGGQGETAEHRRQRLFGAGDSPFGQHGGGVFLPKTE